jgi:hypothetical protein
MENEGFKEAYSLLGEKSWGPWPKDFIFDPEGYIE